MTIHHKSYEQKQFEARLRHLAAFQGMPHWSFARNRTAFCEPNERQPLELKSGFHRLGRAIKTIIARLLFRIEEKRLFRQNVRELTQLNDHVLRDIGLHRGDIAAIVSKSQSIEIINHQREILARPACKVLEFDPSKAKSSAPEGIQVIDNAA